MAGSFFIVFGWNWYHIPKQPAGRFWVITLVLSAIVFLIYKIFKRVFVVVAKHFRRHPFWPTEFKDFLDPLFFIFSLFFLVFFSKNEIVSFVYVSFVLFLFFYRLQIYLSHHPAALPWLAVNRSVFLLGYFIFIFSGLAQYAAHHYFILDSGARFYNIVIFRSLAVTMFWLFGFSVAGFIYWQLKSFWRYILLTLWALFFVLTMFIWAVNVGILYFSGLYLSPFMLSQAGGAGGVVWNSITLALLFLFGLSVIIFIIILLELNKARKIAPSRYWYFYSFTIAFVAVLSFWGVASFKNTPEFIVARSFYRYFLGEDKAYDLNFALQEKLKSFGLFYDLNSYYISHHEKVFEEEKNLLSKNFSQNKPNIIIIFLESFSARLTGAYNSNRQDLTPNLNIFTENEDTTIFHNFYNASTPTVTGLMAQLCSFLPPTGHNEIEQEKKLQNHHLLCLPKILRNNGYKNTTYITAVDSGYANKGSIFASMGADEVLGTEELKKYIKEDPLSWGFSDHQMFPYLIPLAEERAQPFIMMFSTIDTHPPFNISRDATQYKDGKSDVLNSFYSTDDAFGKFWAEFVKSDFYKNTIVMAVADHAVFPAAYDKKYFPEEHGKTNFYDELFMAVYLPNNILPKSVNVFSSSIDLAPTLLQVLNINTPNAFEGHSIFDDREKYSNILGMHEFGLFINQNIDGARKTSFDLPSNLVCGDEKFNPEDPLSLCEFLDFYNWKRQMFVEGRFWEK